MRVTNFDGFIGQERIVQHLKLLLPIAKNTKKMDHILLTGLSGFGKSTLARICANELGWEFHEFDCSRGDPTPIIELLFEVAFNRSKKRAQTVPLLLFLDEVHGLRSKSEGILKVMEDQKIGDRPIMFTVIAATNRKGLLPAAFLNRCQIKHNLEKYTPEQMVQVIKNSAGAGGLTVSDDAANKIENVSRGVPREAQNILRRAADYGKNVDLKMVEDALYLIGLDSTGLTLQDLKYLKGIEMRKNNPQSLKNLEVIVDEQPQTIESVMEPYLIERNLIERTPRGRVLTQDGLDYIGSDLTIAVKMSDYF